jgi:hypothetical protein
VLLHDNTHPHTAAHTTETFWKLKFDVVRPSYTPDLEPSVTCFDPLKGALWGF